MAVPSRVAHDWTGPLLATLAHTAVKAELEQQCLTISEISVLARFHPGQGQGFTLTATKLVRPKRPSTIQCCIWRS